MQQRLNELWYGRRARPSLLQPLGWLYAGVVRARRALYVSGWLRTRRVGRPVIVVGNLTVGGTGKTPLTVWLAGQLAAGGMTVGILSRGYGRRDAAPATVSADSDWRDVGDEPVLLARSGYTTVVARDRAAGAAVLVARGVDVIVADDGLQHLHLARDCEIVVIDGARGFGNGRLLPAGPLREPVAQLAQADAVVVNGPAEHPSLGSAPGVAAGLHMHLVAAQAVRLDGQAPARSLTLFRGQRVHAVAGIGNPARFFRALQGQGIEVIEHAFPDHHPFTGAELRFADDLPVLMTEKDAVKCAGFAGPRLWYVPVVAQFSEQDGQQLLRRVLAKIDSRVAARGQM